MCQFERSRELDEKKMKDYFVYIILCRDKTYYTGITNNLQRRFMEHSSGYNEGSYTYGRRPLKLVYYQVFHDVKAAIRFEKRIKKWSQKKKEAVINDEWGKLPLLSKCNNASSHENYGKASASLLDSARSDNAT